MSINTSISFWQQDQNFWTQAQTQSQTSSASESLITAMGSLATNKAKGLASIATQEAITRTNSQLVAALKSAIAASTGTSSSSAPAAPPAPVAATGTGTVPLTAGTSLLTLGIPPSGTITVSDGTNTTTYASTGTDTVGDLINAINTTAPKNAQVNAYLNSRGHLVIAAQNTTNTVAVGGLFAANVGFGVKNDSFQPTTTATTSSTSTAASPAASTTSNPNTSQPAPRLFNSAPALQTSSATASFLASGITAGSVINLLT